MKCAPQVMGSIPVGDSDFFFVPCSCYVDQFTFHISLPNLKFTIFIHLWLKEYTCNVCWFMLGYTYVTRNTWMYTQLKKDLQSCTSGLHAFIIKYLSINWIIIKKMSFTVEPKYSKELRDWQYHLELHVIINIIILLLI